MNCVDFSRQPDRPQLVSGGDDGLVKVWDYQSKQCLYTFEPGHQDNVSAVCFHPDLPFIFSGGEDHVLNIWNANAFKHETFLNYGLQAVWSIHALPESNYVAIGFEEATVVLKVGKETPLCTYSNGKTVYIKNNEFQHSNFKLISDFKDGDKLKFNPKDLGHCEMYAQSVVFAPNGRHFAVVGDKEFVIYAYPKFVNVAFGQGNEFVWASDSSSYAARLDNGPVRIFKNFEEKKSFKTSFGNEGIYGGKLLGIKSRDFITFYDWDNFEVIRKIDVSPAPKNVYWND